jgi:hypothetical protein
MRSSVLTAVRRRDLALLAGGLLMLTAIAAAATGLLCAHQARAVLAVHFARLPATAGDAAGIWLHNLRVELGVAVFAFLDPASRRLLDGGSRVWRRLLLGIGDVLVAGWALGSSLVAGVLLGAYGTRQLAGFLPDGPVEVTAWLLLIVLYLDVRRGRTTPKTAVGWLAAVAGLLAVAAILELGAGA